MKETMMTRQKKTLTAAFAAFALALTGCGAAAGTSSAGSNSEGLTEVNVGVVPVTTVAPLYVGIEQGFFEEAGLEVTAKPIKTSPAIVAGVQSGELDFGFSATASLLQAKAKNLPLEVVVGGSLSDTSENGTALIAAAGSGANSVTDLAGKKIAVNELQGQSQFGALAAAEKAGVDPKTLTFVALPFPEMVTALDAGRVDAAVMVQPFGTTAENSGHPLLIPDVYRAVDPHLTVTSWFASEQFVAESADTTERFSEALAKSFRYAQENPQSVIDIIPTYTEIPADAAAELPLASTSPEVTMDSLQKQADLMRKYGLLEREIDLSSYVADVVKPQIAK